MRAISVSQLFLYPVKSLRGVSVKTLELYTTGPNFDRQWMVVDPKGKFLTQRILPKMCLIETTLKNGSLSLSQSGHPSIDVPRGGGADTSVTVWRDSLTAHDCGDQVAKWLTKVLGKACRMVFMPMGEERNAPDGDYNFSSQLGFADAYPLLLANEASLADFNSHLRRNITMHRFRPNIVVQGSTAFAEDQWQNIKIGDHAYVLASPCTRCVVPSIDPATGAKDKEVTDALNKYRRFGNETRFGQNLVYQHEATINIEDTVEVSA